MQDHFNFPLTTDTIVYNIPEISIPRGSPIPGSLKKPTKSCKKRSAQGITLVSNLNHMFAVWPPRYAGTEVGNCPLAQYIGKMVLQACDQWLYLVRWEQQSPKYTFTGWVSKRQDMIPAEGTDQGFCGGGGGKGRRGEKFNGGGPSLFSECCIDMGSL